MTRGLQLTSAGATSAARVKFEPLTLWSDLVARAREVAACEFSEADEIQPTARAG